MSAKRKNRSIKKPLISLLLILGLLLFGYFAKDYIIGTDAPISIDDIPEFSGEPYVKINGGIPFFENNEITTKSYESYSELDELGRCGVAMACLGKDLMPTEERGDIRSVTPSGWKQAQYDCVPGEDLYHRCHLIGFQLTGENDNEKNLITGTRFMNCDGMVDLENMVADYIKATNNHVMYRVTPIYEEKYDLVACGVLMEAYSVEDKGEGIQFNVFCYNVQPGVCIDYYDGRSWLDGETPPPADDGGDDDDGNDTPADGTVTYVLNTNSKKIHLPSCSSAASTKPENKAETTKTLDELLEEGYTACGICKP